MNRFDAQFLFRKANRNDADRIMSFIRENWRQDHILGNDRDFFLYEHASGEGINFVLCEDRKSGDLVGIHGFIPYSNQRDRRHVCGVITMVKSGVTIPMLGVELIRRFITLTEYRTYCGIGTNTKTMAPLAKQLFHRNVGKMQHYYCLNEKMSDFKIAKIVDRPKSVVAKNAPPQAELLEFKDFAGLKDRFELNKPYRFLPYKEDWYIRKRYFQHPIYRYRVWGILDGNDISALLMGREVVHAGAKILRLVDFIGDIHVISRIRNAIKKEMEANQYEYVDFFLNGVPEPIMNEAGFALKNDDVNIIPNYFEPFVKANVEVWFETSPEDLILFRADADADRPNISRS